MKAALKAPSANMARKWFGSRKATKNASATGPAPRIAASMMSRRKPVRRETSVKPPTVRIRSIIAAFVSTPALRGRMKEQALARQRAANCSDDTILDRLVEIGMHRQADHFLGQPLAHRRPAVGHREAAIRGLPVQRLGVIDRRRDALSLERGRERDPPSGREPDGVLRPNRGRVIANARYYREIGKPGPITLRHGVSRGNFFRKDFQL